MEMSHNEQYYFLKSGRKIIGVDRRIVVFSDLVAASIYATRLVNVGFVTLDNDIEALKKLNTDLPILLDPEIHTRTNSGKKINLSDLSI